MGQRSRRTGSPRLCGLRPILRLRGERFILSVSTQVDIRRLRLTAEDFQSHAFLPRREVSKRVTSVKNKAK